jgi:hypothetical protein
LLCADSASTAVARLDTGPFCTLCASNRLLHREHSGANTVHQPIEVTETAQQRLAAALKDKPGAALRLFLNGFG